MVCFRDKDRTVVYQGKLFLNNEGLRVAANIHPADCTCMGELLRSIILLI